MNSRERQSALTIARIMRAARKSVGLTQVETAKKLTITQGTLSKFESGLLIPSTPQWFDFCDLAAIPYRSFVLGYIDKLDENSKTPKVSNDLVEDGFKLPAHYARSRGSFVRGLRSILLFLEQKMGTVKYEKYLQSKSLDADFFVNLNHQINLQFLYDVFADLSQMRLISPNNLTPLVKSINRPESHGELHGYYDRSTSQKDLIVRGLRRANRYGVNFNYAIEDEKPKTLEISLTPHEYVTDFKHSSEVGHAICKYKQSFVEEFSGYMGQPKLSLENKDCYYHGNDRCIYRLHLAS